MYILAIVLGFILVAYIGYLFVEILRALFKGEEPKNTLFPFLYKPKKEKKDKTDFTVMTSDDAVADVKEKTETNSEPTAELSSGKTESTKMGETVTSELKVEAEEKVDELAEHKLSSEIDTTVKAREAKKYD